MTRLYAEIAIACSFLMRLSEAASIACLGNNVAMCSAAFDALGPDNGVQSSACIADKCVATCKPWYDAVNGGESCVPKPPKGWARGLEQQIPCPNNDQGICRDAFAPGYFSSGVASTECVDNKCVVTCRPLWESVNSGQYCKRGNTINICKDYETAEVLASNTPECNCWAATSGTAPDITCGCPAGQVFKTTSDFASVNKTLEDMVERGICFDSATDAPMPAVTNAV